VPAQNLLIVGRRDLLDLADGPDGLAIFHLLAQVTRLGFRLVATASLNHDWSKTAAVSSRSRPGPKGLRQLIEDGGGTLDAMYYVPQSLLTQKTRREAALSDILERFGVAPEDCVLFNSSRKFVAVAESLGIRAFEVSAERPLTAQLSELVQAQAKSA